MREAAFRAVLASRPSLGAASLESYTGYAHRVERELGINLDRLDLSDAGLSAVRDGLRRAGVTGNSVANCLTALRRYREFA